MIVFYLLIVLGLGTAAWLMLEPAWIRRRRRRLLAAPVPSHWHVWIAARVPFAGPMPADLRERTLRLAHIFVTEKRFTGCNGLVVSDEMRVVIAFQACLLIVNRPAAALDACYEELRSILVYPAAFVVEEAEHVGDGLISTGQRVLSGQAWESHKVLLSWDDIENPHGRSNVVLHEFAHYLDMENDVMDGAPALRGAPAYARWSDAFWQEYRRLHEALQAGQPTLLDAYAATTPAEFFAVATETFFESPGQFVLEYPGLYEQLQCYFRLDPARWVSNDVPSGS